MYNTSQNYKDKVLADSTQHELNIYIDENKVDSNHIINFKQTIELFNNNEFCLGCTPEIDIEFEIDKRDLPETYNEVYIETGVEDEIVPIGYFTIQKPIEDNEFKVKIKATDYMKKFEDNKYDGSDLTYPKTMLQVLQDICKKIGVELGSTSFLNSDKQIAVYDNTVSARTYLGYIAEQAEGLAVIGRDGKLYIRQIGKDVVEFDINLFKDYKWGDKFKVSKVSYEDGIQDYKFGDETADTVYIDQNNMYIVDREQVENIYNQIKDFEIYSFEGETIIDPAYDIGDILVIDGEKVLYQGELEYVGKFKANIKSKIQAKTEQESMQTKENSTTKMRRVQSEIDQANAKITTIVAEQTEQSQKLSQVTQTVDELNSKVSDIADLTDEVSGIKTITLENCVKGELLELHIYGNNTVFKYLYPADDLYPADGLYAMGDSIIIVTDNDNNSITYDLGITEVLRQNGTTRDEYVWANGVAKVIRRINKNGTIKDNEEIEELGNYNINLSEGTNTIKIKSYSAELYAKYAVKNDYTDIFATKVEMNTSITQTAETITNEVNKKVDETELGTKIVQNYESVQIAWNTIEELIQFIEGKLKILNQNKQNLMTLDKNGQHFFSNNEEFGNMGVNVVDEQKYISFSVNGEYGSTTQDGMAWGITTKSDNKFFPILFIKNFSVASKDADNYYGQLVLATCDLVLQGLQTGIISGNVKMYGNDLTSGMVFEDTSTGTVLLEIIPEGSALYTYQRIKLLDGAIDFFKNQSGSYSLKIGTSVLTDEDVLIVGSQNHQGSFSVYGFSNFYKDITVDGNVYADNISSDRRIKDNIKDSTKNAIDLIMKIKHRQYDKKTDDRHYDIGYIAQELEEVEPNFVIKREKTETFEERYYINELPIIATLTKAIQEQQEQTNELQEKIKEMEGKIK